MGNNLYMLPVLLESNGFSVEAEVIKDFVSKGKDLEKINEVKSQHLNKQVYYGARLPTKVNTGDLWFDVDSLTMFMYVKSNNSGYWIALAPIKELNILKGKTPASIVYFNSGKDLDEITDLLPYMACGFSMYQDILNYSEEQLTLLNFGDYKEWIYGSAGENAEYKGIIDNKLFLKNRTLEGTTWTELAHEHSIMKGICARLSFCNRIYGRELSNEQMQKRLIETTRYLLEISKNKF
jgi:hypothetical protein